MTEDHQRQDAEKRPQDDLEFPTDAEDKSLTETDWGLKKPQSGMGKEMKIVALVLMLLCGCFGYVLYSKTSEPADENASAGETQSDQADTSEHSPPIKLISNTDLQEPDEEESSKPSKLTILGAEPVGNAPAGNGEVHGGLVNQEKARSQYQQQFEQKLADNGSTPAGDPFGGADDWENNQKAGDGRINEPLDHPGQRKLPPRQHFDFSAEDSEGLTSLDEASDVNPFEPSTDEETPSEEAATENIQDDWEFQEDSNPAELFGDESNPGEENPRGNDAQYLNEEKIAVEEGYAAPVQPKIAAGIGNGEPAAEFREEQFHDPRTGPYHSITPHSGQATSTTIVRRPEESLLKKETNFSDPSEATDRFTGYRSVGKYQDNSQRDIETRDAQAAPDEFAEDVAGEFDAHTSQPPDSLEASRRPSVLDDNRDFGFERREQSSLASEFDTGGEFAEPAVVRHEDSWVVEANDSFWSIARQTYGDPRYFQALARHNQRTIPDPQAMRPGVMIATPPAGELERLYPELLGGVKHAAQIESAARDEYGSAEFSEDAEFNSRIGYGMASGENFQNPEQDSPGIFVSRTGEPQYRVASGDNLGSIARRYLGKASRWEEIARLNQDQLADPHRLKIGTVLRLPPDAQPERIVNRPFLGR